MRSLSARPEPVRHEIVGGILSPEEGAFSGPLVLPPANAYLALPGLTTPMRYTFAKNH
jgi:hypothetical protein